MKNTDFPPYANDWLHDEVIKILQDKNLQSAILDIWCGWWTLLHRLHNLWFQNLNWCDGFIENEKLKAFADFKKCNCNKDLGDNYKNESFDIITLVEVIEHLENPNLVLNTIHDLLKKDGYLIITTPNIQTLVSRLLFLFEWNLFSFRENDTRPRDCDFPNHIAPFFYYIFETLFIDKFQIEEKKYWSFIIPLIWRPLPLKNKFFWNNIILVLKKI